MSSKSYPTHLHVVGYARASTLEQNLDLQEDALEAAGSEKVCTDRMSGTKPERPG